MKRLTEEMVIARAKISDLSQIKRFNCWGNELTDVSLLRQMSNVEVLSLSINKINSLVDFQFCRALQDLYVRQNNIKDLNEVCYLQNLPNLKHLWLGENPCASTDGYRLSVLRALPHLQKLDDITITPEELSDATKNGHLLCHPDDEDQTHGDYYTKTITPTRRSTPEISPTRLEPTRQNLFDPDEDQDYYTEPEDTRTYHSPNGKESPPRRNDPESKRIVYSPEPDYSPTYYDERPVGNNKNHTTNGGGSPKQKNDRSPLSSTNTTDEQGFTPDSPKEERLPHSSSVQSVKDCVNGDSRYYHRHNDGSDESNNGHYDYQSQPLPLRQSQSTREVRERLNDRCERPTCAVSHRPPFHRRPVTRNSNILSAVLCLVKELDYPSLEVVEMAVRCRMDEVED